MRRNLCDYPRALPNLAFTSESKLPSRRYCLFVAFGLQLLRTGDPIIFTKKEDPVGRVAVHVLIR